MTFQSKSELFFTRNNPEDIRLGDLAADCSKTFTGKKTRNVFSILGTPDDEGIKRNGGRPGADLAPDIIRSYFYKFTPPMLNPDLTLLDYGDLDGTTGTLEDRHQEIENWCYQQTKDNQFFIRWGGGHDYGFPDSSGFIKANLEKKSLKPLVINFDAHLDVRPYNKGAHSGSPFRQLLEKYPQQFDFWEVGLQPQCNSRTYWNWATDQKAVIIPLEVIEQKGLLQVFTESLEKDLERPVFLSIDLDAFTSNEAPGCSQSWTTGLRTQDFLPALRWLMQSFNVQGVGLYEVSPPYDQDNKTSKLAALLSFHAMFEKIKE